MTEPVEGDLPLSEDVWLSELCEWSDEERGGGTLIVVLSAGSDVLILDLGEPEPILARGEEDAERGVEDEREGV